MRGTIVARGEQVLILLISTTMLGTEHASVPAQVRKPYLELHLVIKPSATGDGPT
jgi:hypothetical protein